MNVSRLSLASLATWHTHRLRAVLSLEFPLQPIQDLAGAAPYSHSLIPPFVYQTWSSNRLGRTHRRHVERFRRLNPELSFVFFDDQRMHDYMAGAWRDHPVYEVFANARYPQLATDVFRYCLIHERGGFWFDISKGLSTPICALLRPGSTGLVSYERRTTSPADQGPANEAQRFPANIVAQYGFGFAPRHPVLAMAIESIVADHPRFRGKVMARPKAAILDFTGPDMFTRVVREYLAMTDDPSLVQTGINFDGAAIWSLPGAYVRFFRTPPYKFAREDVIVG